MQFISSVPAHTKRSVAAVAVVLCLGLAAFWMLTASQEAKAAQLKTIITTDVRNGPQVTAGPWRGQSVTLDVDRGQPLGFEADNSYYDEGSGCTAYFSHWSRWYPDTSSYEDIDDSTLPQLNYTVPNEYNDITLVARYFWHC